MKSVPSRIAYSASNLAQAIKLLSGTMG